MKFKLDFPLFCALGAVVCGVIGLLILNKATNERELTQELLDNHRCQYLPSKATIGFANNNPMNIKGKGWHGQIGVDKQGHAIFESPLYGLRAGAVALKNSKATSISEWVKKYAEGNHKPYINFICNHLGIRPDDELKIMERLPELMEAIIIFENGENPYPPEYLSVFGVFVDM